MSNEIEKDNLIGVTVVLKSGQAFQIFGEPQVLNKLKECPRFFRMHEGKEKDSSEVFISIDDIAAYSFLKNTKQPEADGKETPITQG